MRFTPHSILVAALLLGGCGRYDLGVGSRSSSHQGDDQQFELTIPAAWLNAGTSTTPESETAQTTPVEDSVASGHADGPSAAGTLRGAEITSYQATSNERSGSRIRARVVITDEGYHSWVGWTDRELGEDCDFQEDEHGALRCFPSNATREIYYADAACTQGVVALDTRGADVGHAYQVVDRGCTKGLRPHAVGEQVAAPAALFARSETGACTAATTSATSFRALGPALEPGRFVAARYGTEGTPSRIKAVGLVSDDGAIRVTGFRDSELDTLCSWQGNTEGSCKPDFSPVSLFADEVCTQPLLAGQSNACSGVQSFGVSYDPDTCEATYYRPGAPYQGTTAYELAPEYYEAKSLSAEEAATLSLGEPVSEAEFAQATSQRVTSAPTRIAPVYWVTPDGGIWFRHWYDNTLDASCSFVEAGNGEWRCLPGDQERVVYADAACSQPMVELPGHEGCGARSETPRFIREQATSGQSVRQVLARRPLLATVYEMTAEGCAASAAPADRVHHDLSRALPATDFVDGMLVTQ